MARLDVPADCIYTVTTVGCDDSTTVHVRLTTDEAIAVAKVAEQVNATSTCGCEPRLFIQFDEHDEADRIEVP